MRASVVVFLAALVLANAARAESVLPAKRPDDVRISFIRHEFPGGPDLNITAHPEDDGIALVVSRSGGAFTETIEGEPFSAVFPVTEKDLDLLYDILRSNDVDHLGPPQKSPDYPYYEIHVWWLGGKTTDYKSRRKEVPEASLARFDRILAAFELIDAARSTGERSSSRS